MKTIWNQYLKFSLADLIQMITAGYWTITEMKTLNLPRAHPAHHFFIARTDAGSNRWFVPTKKLKDLFDEEPGDKRLDASLYYIGG